MRTALPVANYKNKPKFQEVIMERIRIGLFGASRGLDLAQSFMLLNCDIVAICEKRDDVRESTARAIGSDVAQYSDFDEFVKHDMDAVVLANYFNEHTPYAIKCFERGLHVYSECISNGTMAEGVELIRAFEKHNSIYMLAENYPQMLFNREMKKICEGGTLGKIIYAEGEYNHPGDPYDGTFKKKYHHSGEVHWRNHLPRTYYVTHSLGPLMSATGATPRRVTAMACFAPTDDSAPSASLVGDRAAIITTQNDDGSVFRFTGCAGFGAHHNAYRFCGTRGSVENLRGMGGKVMLRYNAWEKPEGVEENTFYEPQWNEPDADIGRKTGHGGADYVTARIFVECLREKKQPPHPFDVYAGVAMSSVAILAHRSMLEGGRPYDIPDFRDESARVQYENDRLTPFIGVNGEIPNLPCCSHTDYKPTDEQVKGYYDLFK